MASEEISFLKDQVYRLNHELIKYRHHHLEILEQSETDLPSDGPPPPWFTNKSLLSPLVAEYDAHIKEQQQLIAEYEDELQRLRPEVSRLVQENERLNDRLKDSVHNQLEATGDEKETSTLPIQTDEQMVQNMQFQLDAALQEKKVAIEKWHEAEEEIDRLQAQLQEEKSSHQWGVIEQQAHQMQSEYFETVNLLNRELEQVQQDLRQTRHELETSNLQEKEMRRTNKELEQQLNWKTRLGVADITKWLGGQDHEHRINMWRMNVHGTLPEDLKRRGVFDKNILPGYHFRVDALLLYDAIYKYVRKYVDLYYDSNDKITGDWEIQGWTAELVKEREKGGCGLLGVPGNGSFSSKDQLYIVLTSIIYTCSVAHASTNFPQYDEYVFPPNYPALITGNPPRDKTPLEESQIVKSLPDKPTTLDVMTVTKILSSRGTKSLGGFEVQYIFEPEAKKIVDEFREDLAEIGKIIKQRNTERNPPYTILDPDTVPNSISI